MLDIDCLVKQDLELGLTAIHEVGHAAMHWFFQTRYSTHGISLIEAADGLGRISQSTLVWPGEISAALKHDPEWAELLATYMVMNCLSGPAAENRLGIGLTHSDDWLTELVEYDWDEAGSDIGQARRIVRELDLAENPEDPCDSPAVEFIRSIASLTADAISTPEMEVMIRTVAETAFERKELDEPELWTAMQAAWKGNPLPLTLPPWSGQFSRLLQDQRFASYGKYA